MREANCFPWKEFWGCAVYGNKIIFDFIKLCPLTQTFSSFDRCPHDVIRHVTVGRFVAILVFFFCLFHAVFICRLCVIFRGPLLVAFNFILFSSFIIFFLRHLKRISALEAKLLASCKLQKKKNVISSLLISITTIYEFFMMIKNCKQRWTGLCTPTAESPAKQCGVWRRRWRVPDYLNFTYFWIFNAVLWVFEHVKALKKGFIWGTIATIRTMTLIIIKNTNNIINSSRVLGTDVLNITELFLVEASSRISFELIKK